MAVILVLLHHAGYPVWKFAGTIGVSMFFALSGFLITALLMEERRASGRVSIGGFWWRRACRLLPALVVVVVVCAVVPVRGERLSLGAAAAILGYVGNWVTTGGGNLYPLNQVWTLAIEEQFYVVWPVVMLVLMRWPRRLLGLILALAVASAALRVGLYGRVSFARVMRGTDTNAVCILVGCALAVVFVRGRKVEVSTWIAVTCGVMLVGLSGPLGGTIPGRSLDDIVGVLGGPWEAFGALAGAGLTVAVIAHLVTTGSRVMRWRPLVTVGRMSYGLYLWHFPVFSWWAGLMGHDEPVGNHRDTVVGLVLTAAVAWGSWRFVEQPALRWGRRRLASGRDVQPTITL